MDTAKVDIRKLQLLNDRINQTIDALNQVRFSVHGIASGQGLGHTGSLGQGQNPYAGMGQGVGFSAMPGFGFQNPALQNPALAHAGIGPTQLPSGVGAYGPGQSPFAPPVFANPILAQNPAFIGISPVAPQGGLPFSPGIAGLSHTGGFGDVGRSIWGDPYLAAQIAQTFPYAQSPVPPVMTVY
jgi:hypothetical protein